MKISQYLITLDVETTGVWIEKDKIIEIALVKYGPNGEKETYHKKINPGILIPDAVSKLTGISNEDVKNAPRFKEVAHEILSFMADCDLAGFNVERFDLPLMQREFADVGITFEWKDRKIYDAQKVYHLNEKRDLAAAYQFYCQKELIGAHSALADSEAVYEILKGQVAKYGEGNEQLEVLNKFEYVTHQEFYDSEKRFCWWNGKLYPAFGKYRRQLSLDEIAKKDAGYLKWLLNSDFKDDAKEAIRAALDGEPTSQLKNR